jgi:Prokaryotic membrane lipoprotein lipid attachment site
MRKLVLLIGATAALAACTATQTATTASRQVVSSQQLAAISSPYAFSNALTSTAPSNVAIDTRQPTMLASTMPAEPGQPTSWLERTGGDLSSAASSLGGGQ